jgi:hypothetical protein
MQGSLVQEFQPVMYLLLKANLESKSKSQIKRNEII